MEGDEAGILDPVRLPLGDGEDHPLRDVAGGIEAEFQTIADTGGHDGRRGEPRGRVDGNGSVGGQYSRPERQGRDVAFADRARSEEHTSELQSLMRNSYAVFCLKKKKNITQDIN